MFFNITPFNDDPVLSATIDFTVSEGHAYESLYRFWDWCRAEFVSGSGSGIASDVDNAASALIYTVSAAPTGLGTFANCGRAGTAGPMI